MLPFKYGIFSYLILFSTTSFSQGKSFVDKVCVLEVDKGKKCEGSETGEEATMYYFDKEKEKCTKFTYLGCEGNKNKFGSSDDCIDSCQTAWFIKKNKEEESKPAETRKKSDCELEYVAGDCKALITMWYYNSEKKACEQFGYGGCGGNGNKFDTQRECENFCGDNSDSKDEKKADKS